MGPKKTKVKNDELKTKNGVRGQKESRSRK